MVQQQKLQEEKDKLAATDRRFKVVYKPTESRLQRQRDDQLNAEFTRKAEASITLLAQGWAMEHGTVQTVLI